MQLFTSQRLRRLGPFLALALVANLLWLGVAAAANFATCPHHFGVFHDHQHEPEQDSAQDGSPAADYFAQIAAAPLCSSLPGQTSATPQGSAQPCRCGDLACVLAKASAPASAAPTLPMWLPQADDQAPVFVRRIKPQHPFDLHPPGLAPPFVV